MQIIYALFLTTLASLLCPVHASPDIPKRTPETAQQIDALVQQYSDLDIFSGVVMIADAGKPWYHKAFGLANREKQIPNTTATLFNIGSMNKTFTAVLIYQLIANGKLAFDDTLGQFLSGFPPEAQRITIEQLLNHSSGYGDYHTPDYLDLPPTQQTIAATVAHIQKLPLLFAPGSSQHYSNAGYVLLGAVVETVTGKSYYQNVRERILTPLGLRHIYLEHPETLPNRAIGYFKDYRGTLHNNEAFLSVPKPDGGFYATTTDILTFYQEFFYGERLLSNDFKQKLPIFQTMQRMEKGQAMTFAGGFEGSNTALFEVLGEGITIIVFANMDEPVAEQLGSGILSILRGETPTPPQLPAIQNVYRAFATRGAAYVRHNFEALTGNFHPTDPKDLILNQVGYGLLFDGKVDSAIVVFELNTQLFPDVPNVWDSLGEAWLQKGDLPKARHYYQKALMLDPQLPSAKAAVEKIDAALKNQ